MMENWKPYTRPGATPVGEPAPGHGEGTESDEAAGRQRQARTDELAAEADKDALER